MRGVWALVGAGVLVMAGCVELPLLGDHSAAAVKRPKRTEPVTAAEVSEANAHEIADALHNELQRDLEKPAEKENNHKVTKDTKS